MASRDELRTLISQIYDEKLEEVFNLLSLPEKVSISLDTWTSKYQRESFLGMTCHFMDKLLRFKSVSLGLYQSSFTHSAENLKNIVKSVLNEFSIKEKTVGLVTDNASNMVSMASFLKINHFGCFAHVLNLVVNKFLNFALKNSNRSLNDSTENDDYYDSESESEELSDIFQEYEEDDDTYTQC